MFMSMTSPKETIVSCEAPTDVKSILIDKNPELVDYIFTSEEIDKLIKARGKDSHWNYSDFQREMMHKIVTKNCRNKIIKLSNLKFGHVGLNWFFNLIKANKRISRLYLSNNSLGNEGAIKVAEYLIFPNDLIHLDLSSNGITSEGFKEIFSALTDNDYLVSMNLSNK